MDSIPAAPNIASTNRWILIADEKTGTPFAILEPTYRHALAHGGQLVLSLVDLPPLAPEPVLDAGRPEPLTLPNTVSHWAGKYHCDVKTMRKYLRTGQVRGRKCGVRWQIELRDLPHESGKHG